MNLREVDPLGWTSSAPLFGEVRWVVIEHRCKVEDDEHEPAEGYLQPLGVSKSRMEERKGGQGGFTATRTDVQCSERRTWAIARLTSSSTGSRRSLIR